MSDTPMDESTQLFQDYKQELPSEWHETFDQLVGQGKSPTSVTATIEYVTTPKIQSEVSSEFNVSDVTIRNLQTAVVALGPIDSVRGSVHGSATQSTMELCNHIADRLGWEEGVEYSVSENGYTNSTPQPRILKEGWRSIYRVLDATTTDSETTDE